MFHEAGLALLGIQTDAENLFEFALGKAEA